MRYTHRAYAVVVALLLSALMPPAVSATNDLGQSLVGQQEVVAPVAHTSAVPMAVAVQAADYRFDVPERVAIQAAWSVDSQVLSRTVTTEQPGIWVSAGSGWRPWRPWSHRLGGYDVLKMPLQRST